MTTGDDGLPCPCCGGIVERVTAGRELPPPGRVLYFTANCTHCARTFRVMVELVVRAVAEKVERP